MKQSSIRNPRSSISHDPIRQARRSYAGRLHPGASLACMVCRRCLVWKGGCPGIARRPGARGFPLCFVDNLTGRMEWPYDREGRVIEGQERYCGLRIADCGMQAGGRP